jgi:alkylhydroperoxidase family enzyme
MEEYETSQIFTDAESAALDYTSELTKEKKVDSKIFTNLLKHYSERQVCEIVYLVASEHIYNMTNIGLNIHPDMLCNIAQKRELSPKSKS